MLNKVQEMVINKYVNDLLEDIKAELSLDEESNITEKTRSPNFVYRVLFYIIRNITTNKIIDNFDHEGILSNYNKLLDLLHYHPCPQNRTTGADDFPERIINRCRHIGYYNDRGEIILERKGLLGLTIYNSKNRYEQVTREDVIYYTKNLLLNHMNELKKSIKLDLTFKIINRLYDIAQEKYSTFYRDCEINELIPYFKSEENCRAINNKNQLVNDIDVINNLIEHEAFSPKDLSYLLLRYGVLSNNSRIINLLLNNLGFFPDFEKTHLPNLIHLSILKGNYDLIKLFNLEKYTNLIFSPEIFVSAINTGRVEILNHLLKCTNGRKINNIVPSFKATLLHYAVSKRSPAMISVLLKFGANPNKKDLIENQSPYQKALISGDFEVFIAMIQHSKHKNEVKINNTINLNRLFFDESYPLANALKGGNLSIVNYLLDHGANPTAMDFLNLLYNNKKNEDQLYLKVLGKFANSSDVQEYLKSNITLLNNICYRLGEKHAIYGLMKKSIDRISGRKRKRQANNNLNDSKINDSRPSKVFKFSRNGCQPLFSGNSQNTNHISSNSGASPNKPPKL